MDNIIKQQSPDNFYSKPAATILLRSSWQTCNIGDIAHTLGLGQLVNNYFKDVHIILWPSLVVEPKELELHKRYLSNIEILNPRDNQEIASAIARADFLLHGSGGMGGQHAIEHWLSKTNKPFGIFAVTFTDIDQKLLEILNKAAFVFARETESLKILKNIGCKSPVQKFIPDATFAMDVRNSQAADDILKQYKLEPKQFICAIPRLRYTPYHEFRSKELLDQTWTKEKIRHITETNQKHKFEDAKRLHETIIRWVGETGKKVLVCPEMTYQLDILDQLVVNPLPDNIKNKVESLQEYWMPDAAQGVYNEAACVVSMECHSPIMAWKIGTPALYLRQPEDTIKGQMYHDLNLKSSVDEIQKITPGEVAQKVMNICENPKNSTRTSEELSKDCTLLYDNAMDILSSYF